MDYQALFSHLINLKLTFIELNLYHDNKIYISAMNHKHKPKYYIDFEIEGDNVIITKASFIFGCWDDEKEEYTDHYFENHELKFTYSEFIKYLFNLKESLIEKL